MMSILSMVMVMLMFRTSQTDSLVWSWFSLSSCSMIDFDEQMTVFIMFASSQIFSSDAAEGVLNKNSVDLMDQE